MVRVTKDVGQNIHHGGRKTALRELRVALHEKNNVIGLNGFIDSGVDGICHDINRFLYVMSGAPVRVIHRPFGLQVPGKLSGAA